MSTIDPEKNGVWVPVYLIEMAPTGTSALMLAQLTWLLQPDRTKQRRVAPTVLDEEEWLARADADWFDIGMDREAARRARIALEKSGLIEVTQGAADGKKCTFLRPVWAELAKGRNRGMTSVGTDAVIGSMRPLVASEPTDRSSLIGTIGTKDQPGDLKVTRIEPGSDADPLFAAFWAAYPRKQGKGGSHGARGAWRAAVKKAAPDLIVDAAVRFANDPNLPREETFVPLPATWLNQERWQDGPLPVRPDGRGHATGSTADEAWAEVLDALRRHGRTQTPTFTNKATAQVIGQLGWRNICMSDNLNVTKGQFARLYETAGRAPEGPAAAAGGGA